MDFFNNKNGDSEELRRLLAESFPAQVAPSERTVNVKGANLQKKIKVLKRGGLHVIGHGVNGNRRLPIWFIRPGSL